MSYNSERKDIGMLFRCLDKKIRCRFNKELEAFDITVMQKEVLSYIYHYEKQQDVFQKHIEEFFDSSNPTITGILKRLEAKQLIKRESSITDARYKKLTLTDKGMQLLEAIYELGPKKIEGQLTKNLTSSERDELERLLTIVLEGLDN